MSTSKPMYVFVYGSLLPGLHNHVLLQNSILIEQGTTVGALFSMGAFPALVTNSHLRKPIDLNVKGAVYEIDNNTLLDLDALEGYVDGAAHNLYERVTVDVTLNSGAVVQAFAYAASEYILQSIIEMHLPQVHNGDWKAWADRYVTPYRDADLAI